MPVLGKWFHRLQYFIAQADATLAQVTDDSLLAHILAIDGDASAFDDNLHSLEALYNAISTLSGNVTGDVYFVGQGGDDTADGETWATRRLTVASGYGLCNNGDLLMIGPGSYTEDITFDTDGVTLQGAGVGYGGTVGGTIINGATVVTAGHNVFKDMVLTDTSGVVVTIGSDVQALYNEFHRCYVNATGTATSALHVNGSGGASGGFIKVVKCRLAGGSSAVVLLDTGGGASWGMYLECHIEMGAGHGIHVNDGSAVDNLFKDCTVNGNGSAGTGILVAAGADNHFVGCTVEDCTTKFNVGGTNYLIASHEESQIAEGQTPEEDRKNIYDNVKGRGGPVFIVQVDSISGDTFTAAELIGLGDDAFPNASVYVLQADNAAPEGEFRGITDFVDATGTVSHNAFTAALAAGDWVMIIPHFADNRFVIGGAQTTQDVIDNQAAMLDYAKNVDTTTLTGPGTEDSVYDKTSTTPFHVNGVWLGVHNLAAGKVVRVRGYYDFDDASIADKFTDDEVWTFGGAQSKKWIYMPLNMLVTYELKFTAEQLDGAAIDFYTVVDDGARGS